MKFGLVPVADCAGFLLAHALKIPGGRLKKGHLLTPTDINAILGMGIDTITVAQLAHEDVGENDAANRLGALLADDQILAEAAFTGRVNLYAKTTGIFSASSQVVTALNQVDPGITLATLANDTFVVAGRMIATVKIIPFAVSDAALCNAERIIKQQNMVSVSPTIPRKIGLVATCLPALKPATMDKTALVLNARLALAGSTLVDEIRVEHNSQAVSEALQKLASRCDFLIAFGASAITDEKDVIPCGIRAAGGAVLRFGMPVDPGNLLLTGELDGKPVIGAPGCARSPVENGFDWVLNRMLANLAVDDAYVSSLGVGGLLMEITARPQPREG